MNSHVENQALAIVEHEEIFRKIREAIGAQDNTANEALPGLIYFSTRYVAGYRNGLQFSIKAAKSWLGPDRSKFDNEFVQAVCSDLQFELDRFLPKP